MFGNKVSKETYDNLTNVYNDACKLVSVERDGRINRFVFARNGEHFIIETMGMLSDDVEGWKKQAGLK